MTVQDAKTRIEQLLGWKEGGSDAFSLRALQAFVRDKDPEFDKALSYFLDSGGHFFVTVPKTRRFDY